MTPRNALRLVVAGILLSLSSAMAEPGAAKNVLIFFIDDLRPELGCYGVETIQSPNIDRLADSRVVFDQA